MYSPELSHIIIQELQAKQDQLSWPVFYWLTGYSPTQVKQDLIPNYSKIPFNPDFNRLIADKFNKQQQFYQNLKFYNYSCVWDLICDKNYIRPRIYDINQPDYWLRLAKSNYTFEKLNSAQPVLNNLFFIPFVSEIYICGSSALEQSNANSDLDLILKCNNAWFLPTALIARFWAKMYLKVIGRDVHSFFFQVLNFLSKILNLKFLAKKSELINRDFKQNNRLRFDIGLAVSGEFDFEEYKLRHTAKTWLEYILKVTPDSKLKVFNTPSTTRQLITNPPELNLSQYRTGLTNVFLGNIFKILLSILSIIVFPLFGLQIIWTRLVWNKEITPYVNWNCWDSFTKVGFDYTRIFSLKSSKHELIDNT
ncbi:MAG: hypothetical protein OHK0017_08530 [Patescibacteria group bacterium]